MLYSYQVTIDDIENTVSLDVETPNDKGLLKYEGKRKLKLKTWLESQTGTFGHLIGIATTPVDLDYVLSNYCPWDYEVLEENVSDYSTNLPVNAKS